MSKFFSQIWSLVKKTTIDTRDDFRKLISGRGSTEGPLKTSSSFDSEEFAPRGREGTKANSSVPKNSGTKPTSGKKKVAGQGRKSAPQNPPPNPPPNQQNHQAANAPGRS